MRRFVTKENRALLSELVRTDFKLRYQGSVLGYAWSLLRPLLLFAILYVVFVRFLRLGSDIPHYPIYLLLGIVLWNFFAEMTTQSLGSIVGRGDLIRKIRIPRWMIVFSSSIAAVINLLLNIIVVAIFLVLNKVSLDAGVLILPLVIIEIYIFALGISLFLSAAFVKYRDINYIWEVVMQAGFYITPILYPITMITNHRLQELLLMNPIAQAIQDARYAIVTDHTLTTRTLFHNEWFVMAPLALVAGSFIGGFWYFRKESKYFAENL